MSQNAREHSNSKHASENAPTSEQKKQEPPITGVSPDDPITVIPKTPSKPAP